MSNNYKLRKVTPKDLTITLTTIFGTEQIPIIGIRPAYNYENGKPTETVNGFYYDLALNGKYLPVKILGEKLIDDSLMPPNGVYVEFENLTFKVYSSNGYPCICASADKVKLL